MLRPTRRAALALLLVATGCTKRLYEGPAEMLGNAEAGDDD